MNTLRKARQRVKDSTLFAIAVAIWIVFVAILFSYCFSPGWLDKETEWGE